MAKSAVVLGASGFVGRALTRQLLADGFLVDAVVRDPTSLEGYQLNGLKVWRTSDYLEKRRVDSSASAVIFNCITVYSRHPHTDRDVEEANFNLPRKLFEASLATDLFVNLNTSLPSGISFYALQKRRFSEFAKNFAIQNDRHFVDVNLEHIYGPEQSSHSFCGNLIRKFQNDDPEMELTDGLQQRDFVYIDDVVSALMAISKAKPVKGYCSFEVGSGHAVRVRSFVEKVHQACSSRTVLNFGAIPYRPNEPMYSCANIEKLSLLGWSPSFSLDRGIAATIERKRQ